MSAVQFAPTYTNAATSTYSVSTSALVNVINKNPNINVGQTRADLTNIYRGFSLPDLNDATINYLVELIIQKVTIDHTNLKILAACTYIASKMFDYPEGDQVAFLTLPNYPGQNILVMVRNEILYTIGKRQKDNLAIPQETRDEAITKLFNIFLTITNLNVQNDEKSYSEYFCLFVRYLKYVASQFETK